ncbi:uroporphyrinogen decarboxylase family protein [Candidatus Latescibacterota bacterium]
MKSQERIFAALQRKQPDRVPVLELIIDEKVARAAVPECRDVADCMDILDMDAVGCGPVFKTIRENPDGSYIDEWGVRYKPGPEALSHPMGGHITTIEDARAYTPPDPNVPYRLGALHDLVKRYKGKRAICFHHRAAFMWSAYLMGIETILMNFLLCPEMVEIVMDKVLEANMAIVQNAIHAGAEVVILGDDYAHNFGPLMSPEVFGKFIQPRLKQMIDMIHDEGAYCIKHTDGNIYPLLNMIVSTGPDAVNPIEPAAGMELKRVKELVGDKVCIAGNIDCGHLLPHGSEHDVREAVRQAIADAAEGGGYIVTSSNSIHSSCNPKNLIAMVNAVHEFGVYGLI